MVSSAAEQIEIALRDQRAAFTVTGATLRDYSVGDRPILLLISRKGQTIYLTLSSQ